MFICFPRPLLSVLVCSILLAPNPSVLTFFISEINQWPISFNQFFSLQASREPGDGAGARLPKSETTARALGEIMPRGERFARENQVGHRVRDRTLPKPVQEPTMELLDREEKSEKNSSERYVVDLNFEIM